MQLKIFINQKIELVHITGKEYYYDVDTVKVIDENSEEYKELVESCDLDATATREQKINACAHKLREICTNNTKQGITEIKSVIKSVYSGESNGYLEISGIMINPRDFSLIRIADYSLKVEVIE